MLVRYWTFSRSCTRIICCEMKIKDSQLSLPLIHGYNDTHEYNDTPCSVVSRMSRTARKMARISHQQYNPMQVISDITTSVGDLRNSAAGGRFFLRLNSGQSEAHQNLSLIRWVSSFTRRSGNTGWIQIN
jgi:hypothetical protein